MVSPQETTTVLLELPDVKFTVMLAEFPSSIGLIGPVILVIEDGELVPVKVTVSEVAEQPLALVTVTE